MSLKNSKYARSNHFVIIRPFCFLFKLFRN